MALVIQASAPRISAHVNWHCCYRRSTLPGTLIARAKTVGGNIELLLDYARRPDPFCTSWDLINCGMMSWESCGLTLVTKVKDTLALQTEESGDLDFLTSSEHFVNLRFDTSDLEIAPHCTLHYNWKCTKCIRGIEVAAMPPLPRIISVRLEMFEQFLEHML